MSEDGKEDAATALRRLVADVASAYAAANSLPWAELPRLIHSVHDALAGLSGSKPAEELKPAVSVRQSVSDDTIVCLDCGAPFAMLRRHLREAHGLSPQDYRNRWKLPGNYPLVAPAYSRRRSDVAKTMGLGQKAVAKTGGRKRRRT
jgi:predicted transcriptional regulator